MKKMGCDINSMKMEDTGHGDQNPIKKVSELFQRTGRRLINRMTAMMNRKFLIKR
jgi:hypothetical protein